MDSKQILGRCLLATCVLIGIAAIAPRLRHSTHPLPANQGLDKDLHDAADHPHYGAKEAELKSSGLPVSWADLATPRSVNAASNAGPLYLQLIDSHRYPGTKLEQSAIHVTDAAPPPDAWAAARSLIATQPGLIQMANQAGALPECYIGRPQTGDPQTILFPEVAQIGRAARIITVESLLDAHDGHPVQAVALQSEGFTVAEHARQDAGLLFSCFVGLECDLTTLGGMQTILRNANGAPEVAKAVDKAVEQKWRKTLPWVALANETAFGNSEIHSFEAKGPGRIMLSIDPNIAESFTRDKAEWIGFIDLNGTAYLDLMQQSIAAAKLPYPSSVEQLSVIASQRSTGPMDQMVLPNLLYPRAAGYCIRCNQITAKAAVTRAACAVFLYKSTHGAYPSTLADAVTTANHGAVIDPFDGKPISYRREQNGFVVYSVGPTGQYNGSDSENQHEEAFRYSATN